jgi:ribonuclease HI
MTLSLLCTTETLLCSAERACSGTSSRTVRGTVNSATNSSRAIARHRPRATAWQNSVPTAAQSTSSVHANNAPAAGPRIPIGQLLAPADGGEGSAEGGTARLKWVLSGKVQIDPQADDYIDATAHTNNTGELSALYYALVRAGARPRDAGKEVVHTDSLYALNMATGKWMPSKKGKHNADLIARLRRAWRKVQRKRPNEVTLRHVRSHVGVPGNELADMLADAGAKGGDTTLTAAKEWIQGWLARQGRPGGGQPPGRPPGREGDG